MHHGCHQHITAPADVSCPSLTRPGPHPCLSRTPNHAACPPSPARHPYILPPFGTSRPPPCFPCHCTPFSGPFRASRLSTSACFADDKVDLPSQQLLCERYAEPTCCIAVRTVGGHDPYRQGLRPLLPVSLTNVPYKQSVELYCGRNIVVSACASPCPMWADPPIQMFHSICDPIIHTWQNLFSHHDMPRHLPTVPPVGPSARSVCPRALTVRTLQGFTQASRAETRVPDTPSVSCSLSCSTASCLCESCTLPPTIVPRLWHSLVRHHARRPRLQGPSPHSCFTTYQCAL